MNYGEERIRLAGRMAAVQPSPSAVISARARAMRDSGENVIVLSAGGPEFPTPQHVQDAARDAIRCGETRYMNADGTPALKAAVRRKFPTRQCTGIRRCGSDHGSRGESPNLPCVPRHRQRSHAGHSLLGFLCRPDSPRGGAPVFLRCGPESGFKLTPEALERAITPRTRWLVLNSPGNPSGAGYSAAELEA